MNEAITLLKKSEKGTNMVDVTSIEAMKHISLKRDNSTVRSYSA